MKDFGVRHSPIIVYEPIRNTHSRKPGLGTALLALILAVELFAGAMHLMWVEAAAVARHPLASPSHTLLIATIWLAVNGAMLWGLWQASKILWKVLRGFALFASDVAWSISSGCTSVRRTLFGTWGARR